MQLLCIGPNDGDKNQATNELQHRTKVGQGLTNGAGSKLRSQTSMSAGGTGCAVRQTVNSRGEGVIQDHRPDMYSQGYSIQPTLKNAYHSIAINL